MYIALAALAIAPLMAWIAHRSKDAKIQARRDIQRDVLAKFSTGDELAKFIDSDGGRRLLNQLADEGEDPRQKILGGLYPALILSALGLGLWYVNYTEVNNARMLTAAVLVGALGAGFFAATALSYYLSKSWGLFKRQGPGDED